MDKLSVFIENFPTLQPWWADYAPIAVAFLALIVSILSLKWSIKQFKKTSRPFAWLIDFSTLNNQKQLINHPDTFATVVSNAPAKINKAKYEFYHLLGNKKNIVHSHDEENFVRFPSAANTQSTYTVPNFQTILAQLPNGITLHRYLRIDYSFLSGKEKYYFEILSKYNPSQQRWETIKEDAL